MFAAGDAVYPFRIQSLSRPFRVALLCEAIVAREEREKLGVNSTGLPFNAKQAVERAEDGLSNPTVNAGAIAATSLAPGERAEGKWPLIVEGFSRFAGRPLAVDGAVYPSERATNQRNLAIAKLLAEQGGIWFDPAISTDLYTRQCSLTVTTHDPR